MKFNNMRILITGGGTGIGKALAIAFIKRKAKVAVCGRRLKPLQELQSVYPDIRIYKTDIVVDKEINALKDKLDADMQGIDVLIINAGRMVQFDIQKGFPDTAKNEVELNFLAPLNMIKIFLPQLMQRKRSAIINVSSGYALWPSRSAPVYGATKSALHFFTKSLRWQLEKTPVKVIEILPPVVKTPAATVKGGMDPDVFANRVIDLMEKGYSEIMIGEVKLLAVMRNIAPAIIDQVLKRR